MVVEDGLVRVDETIPLSDEDLRGRGLGQGPKLLLALPQRLLSAFVLGSVFVRLVRLQWWFGGVCWLVGRVGAWEADRRRISGSNLAAWKGLLHFINEESPRRRALHRPPFHPYLIFHHMSTFHLIIRSPQWTAAASEIVPFSDRVDIFSECEDAP